MNEVVRIRTGSDERSQGTDTRSDTKEKPFHCRYCGRRYARKYVKHMPTTLHNSTNMSPRDLVNRHERSFHPHADGLDLSKRMNSIGEHNDVAMSEIPNLPTPPSQTSESFSDQTNFQTRSPWQEEYPTTRLLEMLSPHSDTMPVDAPTYGSEKQLPNLADGDSPAVHIPIATHQQVGGTSLHPNVDEQAISLDDQLEPRNSHLSCGSLNLSGEEHWDASNMACPGTGYGDWSLSSRSGVLQDNYANQNIFTDDFDLITIDSMALNHAALDADLSTYMNDSGSGSGTWNQIPRHYTQDPVRSPVGLPEDAQMPIEASALNVGIPGTRDTGILSNMPSLLKEAPRKTLASPMLNENIYYAIITSVRVQRSTTTDMEPLMSLAEMQQFLKCYLVCFHRHCPIIHLPSLDLETVPCHLILAMCAIGALYRLRRKTAHDLWQCANQICEKVCSTSSRALGNEFANRTHQEMDLDTNGDPLTASATANMQCKLLVTWFSVFSGDMTQQAISVSGLWATVCTYKRRIGAVY
jgi:hypothetical protein